MISFHRSTLPGNCYLDYLYNTGTWQNNYTYTANSDMLGVGTKWFLCGFIDRARDRQLYKELTARHKLLYQSEVRYNRNSGNRVFFCIFDRQ